jgi:hypothetical protein
MQPHSPIATLGARADLPPTAPSPFLGPTPLKRSRLGPIFPEAVVRCINEARPPVRDEIEAVAAKIWSDVQAGGGTVRWRQLIPGSIRHRRMIAAARAALSGQAEPDPEKFERPP